MNDELSKSKAMKKDRFDIERKPSVLVLWEYIWVMAYTSMNRVPIDK